MKFDKLDCKAVYSDVSDSSNLMKVTLSIVHSGLNQKGTNISDFAMRSAENSIKNAPILGYVLRDEDDNPTDFDTHNVDTVIVKTDKGFDVEQRFIEVPLGVIPESCNARYECIDGINYFTVDGYIWKSYSNKGYKLIEDSECKSVSMEIKILDGKFDDDNVFNINSYEYEGVTILGDHVLPGISGANISKYSRYSNYKQALEEIYNEIYSLESEVDNMPDVTEVVETVEEVQVEEANEVVEEVTAEIAETVEETIEEVEEIIETETAEEIIEEVVEVEETVEETVENPLDVFSILFDEVPGSLQEIAVKLHERFNKMSARLDGLTKFKADRDKEVKTIEIDGVISEYTELSEDEICDLRYDAIENDLDMDVFKEKLASLAYKKIKANKNAYSADTIVGIVPIIEKTEENGYEPYGGLFK